MSKLNQAGVLIEDTIRWLEVFYENANQNTAPQQMRQVILTTGKGKGTVRMVREKKRYTITGGARNLKRVRKASLRLR